ncbi:nuclear receptor subfamily 5 group A member 2-like [Oryzias latipes]|uniref:Nuclear receptor subfamily 5, group A, member 1b n=1 Tax=Oryzias latipes TaxID=8090 RepID=H2MDA0_ORYLA|nr:nuclear receptor subfamily 5 group A member 2-like [Oryzias latipes]
MEFGCEVDLEELCPVCGDKVSGYHYGLLTCESCKGFFKRTVQNNKIYACVDKQQCRIDKAQRKRCPFCRFQKCLHVGMRIEAVRADRMRGGRNKFGPTYKRDRALKQQQREAYIRAHRFRTESGTPVASWIQNGDFTFTESLNTVTIQKLSTPSLQSFGPTGAIQNLCSSASSWTIKSMYSNTYAGSAVVDAVTLMEPCDPCSKLRFTQDPRMPPLVMEFLLYDPDELQLQRNTDVHFQQELTGCCSYRSTFKQVYAMVDLLLHAIVEWARMSALFKQLQISDQMKLLHHCWSELLALDIISGQILYDRQASLLLIGDHEVELPCTDHPPGPSLFDLSQRGQALVEKLHILKVDHQELASIKYLILFNPAAKELEDPGFIEKVKLQVGGALLEYTRTACPQLPNRLAHLLEFLSELRPLSCLAEEYLYCRHLRGEVPCNSLLDEMLHAKHNCP